MIEKEAARELKDAANALAEAEQHLRTAGDFSEGVVEAAAADYLSKRSDFDDAVDAVQAQEDEGDPTPVAEDAPAEEEQPKPFADKTRDDLAADAAASATGRDAGGNDHSDDARKSDEDTADTSKSDDKSKAASKGK